MKNTSTNECKKCEVDGCTTCIFTELDKCINCANGKLLSTDRTKCSETCSEGLKYFLFYN